VSVRHEPYEPGTFCWAGLAASDPAAAQRFYAELLGWEADVLPGGGPGSYALLRRRGLGVAILYEQMPEARAAGAAPHWTSFISVEDADATAARAGELGGAAVFREPFDVLDAGRVAAIRDPAGAIVSLWQPGARAGAELVDDAGALCWNELATSDVGRAASFYGALLGWEYDTGAGGYVTIKNAGRSNGAMRELSARDRGAPPHWLPWFTVDDVDEIARRAVSAGGNRLTLTSRNRAGRAAVLADPQGAAFAVFEGGTDP